MHDSPGLCLAKYALAMKPTLPYHLLGEFCQLEYSLSLLMLLFLDVSYNNGEEQFDISPVTNYYHYKVFGRSLSMTWKKKTSIGYRSTTSSL